MSDVIFPPGKRTDAVGKDPDHVIDVTRDGRDMDRVKFGAAFCWFSHVKHRHWRYCNPAPLGICPGGTVESVSDTKDLGRVKIGAGFLLFDEVPSIRIRKPTENAFAQCPSAGPAKTT